MDISGNIVGLGMMAKFVPRCIVFIVDKEIDGIFQI